VKIAVIGEGERGLSAAYLLSHHRGVKLFEREKYRGAHVRTFSAKDEYVAYCASSPKGTDDVRVR
jgi:predicted NAD/FAD-binding protein